MTQAVDVARLSFGIAAERPVAARLEKIAGLKLITLRRLAKLQSCHHLLEAFQYIAISPLHSGRGIAQAEGPRHVVIVAARRYLSVTSVEEKAAVDDLDEFYRARTRQMTRRISSSRV